jgi:hypothetical protein
MSQRGILVKTKAPLPVCEIMCFLYEEDNILIPVKHLSQVFQIRDETLKRKMSEHLYRANDKEFLGKKNKVVKYLFSIYDMHEFATETLGTDALVLDALVAQCEVILNKNHRDKRPISEEEEDSVPQKKRPSPAPSPVLNNNNNNKKDEKEDVSNVLSLMDQYAQRMEQVLNNVHEKAIEQHKETIEFKMAVDALVKEEARRVMEILRLRLHKDLDRIF